MDSRSVSTKTELETAKNDHVDEIIVVGKLANDLHKTKKIVQLSAGALALLAVALATIPLTGGTSAPLASAAFAPVAATTGFEVASLVVAVSIGLGLIIALFKDYEEIEFSNGRLILRKKRKG